LPNTPLRILAIDDDRDHRLILSLVLEDLGFEYELAEDGLSAIQMAQCPGDQAFDVILLDMQMPGLSGLDVVQGIRAAAVLTPIVAMSAEFSEQDKIQYMAGGCTSLLQKPLDPTILQSTLESQIVQAPENAPPTGPEKLVSTMANNQKFAKILSTYIQGMPQTVLDLKAYRADNDLEATRTLVHRLRGTARSFGFPDIGDVAEASEERIIEEQAFSTQLNQMLDQLVILLEAASL
jgi:CheY-like chemotaxis protein/HPt (histidine-containing phosphotransfer) domain-containing protein